MHEVDPEVVVSEGMRVLLMRALGFRRFGVSLFWAAVPTVTWGPQRALPSRVKYRLELVPEGFN